MKKVSTFQHALYAALVTVACAHAQPPEQVPQALVKLDIGAQPLVDALNSLARQAGLQLLLDAGISAQSRLAPPLEGSFTAEAALQKLLADSDLRYEFLDQRTVKIRSASEANTRATWEEAGGRLKLARADAGQVRDGASSSETDSRDEVDEVVVKGTTLDDPILSSRLGDTLRERPQSVSIVTRERLDEQNLHDLGAALEQTTGITVTKETSVKQYFYSRGFRIADIHVDGGAPLFMDTGGFDQEVSVDLALYEQVEVLRGADALFAGNGEPGGTIQLMRKRPTASNRLQVGASAGSWNNYRGQVDASGPLGLDGRVRGRALYMNERSGSYQKGLVSGSRNLLYAVLEADATDRTQIALGGTYSKSLQPLNGLGLPRFSDGRDLRLPRSVNLAPDWSRSDAEGGELFVRLDQRFGDSWNLRINAMRSKKDGDYLAFYQWGEIDPVDLTGYLYGINMLRNFDHSAADITLRGEFELLGRAHKVILGADWQKRDVTGPQWSSPFYTYNPFEFDPGAYPVPGRTAIPANLNQFGNTQDGLYASLNLHVADPLHIVAGARYSNYDSSYERRNLDPVTGEVTSRSVQQFKESGVLTPYVGFTYELPRGWVGYGSFAEVFQSQASFLSGPLPGKPVDPKTGRNLEFGVKGELGGGRAFTQLALYQVDLSNVALQDASYPGQIDPSGNSCCYLGVGEVRSRGFDAEINGRLSDRWTMFVGYTWNENEYKSGYASETLGTPYMPRTPKHMLKLWTTYQLPANLSRLKLSAGVNAQSRNFAAGTVTTYDPDTGAEIGTNAFEFTQGAYAILSARAQYELNDTWSAALNLGNILDKTYYHTVSTSVSRNWYGAPRNYTLSIQGKW